MTLLTVLMPLEPLLWLLIGRRSDRGEMISLNLSQRRVSVE